MVARIKTTNVAVAALLFSLSNSYYAYAASAAGTVIYSSGSSSATQSGKTRNISRGTKFFVGDKITTGANTVVRLCFTDNSIVALQPNSSFSVNSYSYNKKTTSASSYSTNLASGGLRTLTGQIAKLAPQSYKVNSSAATIGVRGTDFSMVYDEKGGLYTGADIGEILVSNQAGSIKLGPLLRYQYAYIANQFTLPVGLREKPELLQRDLTILENVPERERIPTLVRLCQEYFYAGIDGSWDPIKYRTQASAFLINNINVLAPNTFPTAASNLDVDLTANNVTGDIFVGWQLIFHDLYTLGIEAFGGLSSAETKFGFASIINGFSIAVPDVSITMKHYYGIAFQPGVKLSPSVTLYGNMAIVNARFGVSDAGGILTSLQFPLNFRLNKFGTQLGVGMGMIIPGHHFGIRGEYDWIKFNSIDRREGNGIISIPEAITINAVQKIQPTLSEVKFGVFYTFT